MRHHERGHHVHILRYRKDPVGCSGGHITEDKRYIDALYYGACIDYTVTSFVPAPSLIRINNTNNLIYRKRSQKGIKITKDQAFRDAKDSVPDTCHPLHLAALDPGKKKEAKILEIREK